MRFVFCLTHRDAHAETDAVVVVSGGGLGVTGRRTGDPHLVEATASAQNPVPVRRRRRPLGISIRAWSEINLKPVKTPFPLFLGDLEYPDVEVLRQGDLVLDFRMDREKQF